MLTLNQQDLAALSAKAACAPRLRANQNFHVQLEDPIQRLAIAMEPDTYVRPHRHDHSWEMLIALSGAFEVIVFDEAGVVQGRHRLGADGARVFEMPANTWHSVVSLQPGSVVFEVKHGPYLPLQDQNLAAWSPVEGSERVPAMLDFLRRAQAGQRFDG
ncbi:WbuC family cupin fold metalloprotein [Chromobacterium sp. S0633]|uniref:WbuC family cupin fold metalloprotein n=1 Tax=unclassified Chromobacterium TaxID=2641838 RepID=UPI000D30C053|nr:MULTISPECIES: WbuC family cupin fold metalloprotein [unclassified Chromobacterium]MCP1288637.1 WbuC family cupin fold metalloprotein [Chromobacterium sp. S0633]PTU63529.1 cupin fold metalloprotein, WbuC family [Chromobacterium sp. Panama]